METKNKFKRNFTFVEPLYKKPKTRNKSDSEKKVPCVDRTVKLRGDDFNVKTIVTHNGVNVTNLNREINKEYRVALPGACDRSLFVKDVERIKDTDLTKELRKQNKQGWIYTKSELVNHKMLGNSNNYINKVNNVSSNEINNIGKDEHIIVHQIPDTWLRVYPAPKLSDETIYSVLVRCLLCQLGLATFLVIWTLIAIFTVQSFEGPHETRVSLEFEKEQNQLVIDLATELRQIIDLFYQRLLLNFIIDYSMSLKHTKAFSAYNKKGYPE